MSIDDDVALFQSVPTLRLLGSAALRVLAIGSEQREFQRGEILFHRDDEADAGFVVRRGAFRLEDGASTEIIAGPRALMGELAMVVPVKRRSTATALERSSVIRIPRSLFQRVLEADPAAARRLRDEFIVRSGQITDDLKSATAKLNR